MQIVSEIAEILASAADGVLILWFLVSYFGAKRKIDWWRYAIWLTAIFLDTHYLCDYADLQAVVVIVLTFTFSYLYLKGKAVIKLIATLIMYILIAFINIGTIQCVAIASGTAVQELIVPGSILRILVLCISKLTLFVALYLIEKFLNKEHYMKKEEGILLIALYAIFFLVSIISIKLIVATGLKPAQQRQFLLLSLLMLVINIFLFWLVEKMNHQNQCAMENEILKVQLEHQENQVCNIEQLYQNARKIRHDMKHYITTYLELLKEGETELVIEEMQKLLQTQLDTDNIFYIEGKMLNAVINQKASLCREKGIPLEVQITGVSKWKNESNIAILLSNLLDNAIEAEGRQEEKKEIVLKIFSYKENINILVKNYIRESVLEKNPDLKTTKKKKGSHGIGIGSVKEIVRQEEGSIDIFEKEHYFVIHILLPEMTVENR